MHRKKAKQFRLIIFVILSHDTTMDKNSIQYIFLDLDGTIIDSVHGITRSAAYALEHFGIHVDDLTTLHKFIGPPLKDSFKEFYQMTDEQADEAIVKYRERYRTKGIFENTLYPGIEQFLKAAAEAGYKLVLATSKPEPFAKKILEYFNLHTWFTFVGGCGLDGSKHAKADVIAYILEELGITDTRKIVMVGDRKHDVLGAATFNIPTVGVLYGYGSAEELTEAGAVDLVKDTEELTRLFS